MKAHHYDIIPCGLLLLVIGLFIRYQIGKRRFNRRSITGLQQFSSYGAGVLTILAESMIYFIGTIILWAGIFLLAIAGFNHLKF
jgi:hypothetical protein